MSRAKKRRNELGASAGPRRTPVLGVDVGGVLVDRVGEESDTSFFGSKPMDTPTVPESLAAVRELADAFDGRVHIVSKAGPKIAALTREWLGLHGYLAEGAIPPGNVHFVRRRPDKHPICQRFGITHFVDDRLDVHQHLTTVEHRYLFIGGLGAHTPPTSGLDAVTTVSTWPQLVELARATLQPPT